MTISATAQPLNSPPRVLISVSVPAGNTMSALSVWRDDSNGRTLIRVQPLTGFDSRTVFDYEAPYGQAVVYGWAVTYGATTVTEFAAPVTLAPADAWLIAPQSPSLSFPLAQTDPARAGLRAMSSQSYATNTTVHQILGAALPVTTTSGPRQAQATGLEVTTVTAQEQTDLTALLATDVPILVNVPPAWGVAVPFGYFQIGDVDVDRLSDAGTDAARVFTLPMTQVRTPVVDVEADWTYADVATDFANYLSLLGAYASYSALASDVRS